eukprot:GFUD01039115.1.p1 GENE.GFUD01039115.1~~GFUD01039115.1.p1  ORF type:complete len:369 (+),score=77.94 GFUD01039115.1:55-1107(+)
MSYKLKFSDASVFTEILLNTIQMWCCQEPDVFFISSEGLKIYSQKILLSFYSPVLRDVLSNINNDTIPGISVPVDAENISMLLKVLERGLVVSSNKNAFLEVGEVAKILGIAFNAVGSETENYFGKSDDNQLEIHQEVEDSKFELQQRMQHDAVMYNFDVEDTPSHIKEEIEEYDLECKLDSELTNPLAVESGSVADYCPSKVISLERMLEIMYKCEECAATFKKNSHLERHMLIHTSEQPFTCNICTKSFASTQGLVKHMKKVHNQDVKMGDMDKVPCPKCGKKVKKLGDHIKKNHKKEIEECNLCGASVLCKKKHWLEGCRKCQFCENNGIKKVFRRRKQAWLHFEHQ